MSARKTPGLSAPRRPSVFDEMVSAAVEETPATAEAAEPEAEAAEGEAAPAAEEAPAGEGGEDGGEPAARPARKTAPRKAAARTATPRKAAPRKAAAGSVALLPLPAAYANESAKRPLQVQVPLPMHWRFKVAAMSQATDMTKVITALLSVYTHDPELAERLIGHAEERGVTLGELLHEALAEALDGLDAEE